jgi:hypothetical protein
MYIEQVSIENRLLIDLLAACNCELVNPVNRSDFDSILLLFDNNEELRVFLRTDLLRHMSSRSSCSHE